MLALGFFFGQLYFGVFNLGSTLAGVAGLVVGGMGAKMTQEGKSGAGLVLGLFALGFCGITIDAFAYYTKYNVPGNDFGWFLKAPYVAALGFLSIPAIKKIVRPV